MCVGLSTENENIVYSQNVFNPEIINTQNIERYIQWQKGKTMGHTVNYYSYSEAADKKKVEADLSTYVEKECWQEGGHMSKIRWINDAPCANEDEAREKIERLDK